MTTAAERALALARDRGERGNEAHALRVRAEIARRQGDVAGAEAADHEARDLALALGMRPLVAACDRALDGLR